MIIGNYEIFDNQQKAGEQFFRLLIENKSPVCCSWPQGGKTGTNIYAVSRILDYCSKNNINKFKILYVLHAADKAVISQTQEDFNQAFGEGYGEFTPYELFSGDDRIIQVIHRPEIKRIKNKILTDHIYFALFDECHEAINMDGLHDQLCTELFNKVTWYKGYSSATPFVHNVLNQNKQQFETVILEPSDKFYSPENYWNAGRIKQAGRLFEKGINGDNLYSFWFPIVFKSFTDKIKKNGHGYCLLRIQDDLTEEDESHIISYLKLLYNIDCKIVHFNSKIGNIRELEMKLKSNPKDHSEIIIIKQSLRLGKRVRKTFVRCAIDTANAKSGATTFQSLLGRMCGNDVDNFDFDIFTDTSEVQLYIKWWHELQTGYKPLTIPSSNYNSSNVYEKKACQILIFDDYETANQELQLMSKESWFKPYHKKGWKGQVSKNNERDICDWMLNKNVPSDNTLIYHMDGANPNFINSWNQVLIRYPDIQSKWILFVPEYHSSFETEQATYENLKNKKLAPLYLIK